jgi:hypothetical protein
MRFSNLSQAELNKRYDAMRGQLRSIPIGFEHREVRVKISRELRELADERQRRHPMLLKLLSA